MNEKMLIALNEFWYVGWVLVVIIGVIAVGTGFIKEYIPQDKFQKKLKNQGTVVGAFTGASLGILTPFCSAAMVPVAMGMIEMSVPFSTVLPFLIAAPLSNFVVVGIIFGTFGFRVAAIYFLWTFGGAVLAGLTVGRSGMKNLVKTLDEINKGKQSKGSSCSEVKVAPSCCATANSVKVEEVQNLHVDSCGNISLSSVKNHKEKAKSALRFAKALFTKIVPYAILGAAISGLALGFIPNDMVEKYAGSGAWYAIPFASIIGVPLYLRIEMAIPLLNTLLGKGMSMGAAMALLIGGTGASLPELALLSSILRPKGVALFTLTVLAMAMSGGLLFLVI